MLDPTKGIVGNTMAGSDQIRLDLSYIRTLYCVYIFRAAIYLMFFTFPYYCTARIIVVLSQWMIGLFRPQTNPAGMWCCCSSKLLVVPFNYSKWLNHIILGVMQNISKTKQTSGRLIVANRPVSKHEIQKHYFPRHGLAYFQPSYSTTTVKSPVHYTVFGGIKWNLQSNQISI